MDHDIDPRDELALTQALQASVDGAEPPPELRDRLGAALRRGTPAQRWLPTAAAALVVVGLVLVAVGLVTDDGGEDELATAPEELTTTTAPATTTEAPAVLGDQTVRDGLDDPVSDQTTVPDGPSTTSTQAPATTATVAPAPPPTTTAAPTTTAPPCRNSTDPACGPFRWDPAPTNRPAALTIGAPATATVNVPVRLELSMTDPDGPVTFDCYSVALDRPGVSTGACVIEQFECPERYGPWSPPPPRPGADSTDTEVTFQETGTYVVTVSVSRPDGCDNVDPYRSGATAQVTVEVQPA